MIRVSLFAGLALVLLGANFADASPRSEAFEMHQKYAACKTKIEPKGLKGAALKGEYHKCLIDPDMYK